MLLAALALPLLMLAGAGLRARFVALAVLIAVYVPLAGAGPSLQRAGRDGPRRHRRDGGLATGLALVRAAARGGGHAGLEPARLGATPAGSSRSPPWPASCAALGGARWPRRLRCAAPWRSRRPRGRARAAAPRRRLADGVALTVAATLATAPLLAHHFGSVPLAGLPANLLALPAVAPAMWLGMLKTALGQLAASPPTSLPVALGAVACGVRSPTSPARRSAAPTRLAAQLPLALGSTPAVLAAYASMAAAGARCRAASATRRRPPRRRSPLAGTPRPRPRRALAAAGAIALAAALAVAGCAATPRRTA